MINIFFICLHIYHHLYIINHCPWILSHRLIIKLAKAPEKRIVFQGLLPKAFYAANHGASVGARTRTEGVGGLYGIQFHHGCKFIRLFYYIKLNGKIKGFAHNILKKIIIL